MDSERFDAMAQRLAKATSRRATFRALVATALAPALGVLGAEADAAPAPERCVNLGDKCSTGKKGKKGKKADKCCGNGQCKGGRCGCPAGKKECNGKCIKKKDCCTNNDCGPCQSCTKDGTCSETCIANQVCDAQTETCQCATGFTACGAACVDTDVDANNCGACGKTCAAGERCVAGDCVVVVTPSNMQGWGYYKDDAGPHATLTPEFVDGPSAAPRGSGSARLLRAQASDGSTLSAHLFLGVELKDFKKLEYSTYRPEGSPDNAPSLQLGIHFNTDGGTDGWNGRLVFVPADAEQAMPEGKWTTWDPMNDSGKAWFFSRWNKTVAEGGSGGVCSPSAKCTWAEALAAFPNLRIHPTGDDGQGGPGWGFIGVKVGTNESNLDAYVDAITLEATSQRRMVFDFEPDAAATQDAGKTTRDRKRR